MQKKRHRSRQVALQVLFACYYTGEDPENSAQKLLSLGSIAPSGWNSFSRSLVSRATEKKEQFDKAIEQSLISWRMERLAKIDVCILRLALGELEAFPDIPKRVTLNEYIELAKEFGTDESFAFVNGILDRLAQQKAISRD